MYENGFFDYIEDILGEVGVDRCLKGSGRLFDYHVIIVEEQSRMFELINSLRFVNYFVEIGNVFLDYIDKKAKDSGFKYNEVLVELKGAIESYDKKIEVLLEKRGIDIRVKTEYIEILTSYGLLKFFGGLYDTDATKEYINLYNVILSGYTPCGWAGKIPVGGSLYVY